MFIAKRKQEIKNKMLKQVWFQYYEFKLNMNTKNIDNAQYIIINQWIADILQTHLYLIKDKYFMINNYDFRI